MTCLLPAARFNRRNAEWCRWTCSRRHPNASAYVRRVQGPRGERSQTEALASTCGKQGKRLRPAASPIRIKSDI
jgi:hypothetical protein